MAPRAPTALGRRSGSARLAGDAPADIPSAGGYPRRPRARRAAAMTELAHPDRLAKLAQLRELGIDPYPARGLAAEPIAELVRGAGTLESPGQRIGSRVAVAGLGVAAILGWAVIRPLSDRRREEGLAVAPALR